MGAIIEAVQTSQHRGTTAHKGVVCIFCGLPTRVQTSGEGTSATHEPRPDLPGLELQPVPGRRLSIVRCEICGKEAPYLAHEIIQFGEELREPGAILRFARDAI